MAVPKTFLLGIRIAVVITFLLGLALLLAPGILSNSKMDLSKSDEIPDIKQTDKRFEFPDKGLAYCAPVVVLDAFVWLHQNGYTNILVKDAKGAASDVETCKLIAKLMGTAPVRGTTTEEFLQGLQEYITKKTPYKIWSLKYRGWNRHSANFDDEKHDCADISWIKNGVRENRCEWLNIGWYRIDPVSKIMERQEGHWVILVGYGIGLGGNADPNTLIVRDPSPVLSQDPRKIFITVAPLSEGQMTGPHEGLPRDAKNYLFIKSMGNGVDSSGNRKGIIDGAIVLDLYPSWFPFK